MYTEWQAPIQHHDMVFKLWSYCPIHTSWLIWVKFTIDLHGMLFMRDLHIAYCWTFENFVQISTERAVLFLWAYMNLYLHMIHETVWHFESKEILGKVCELHKGVHHLQVSCTFKHCMTQKFQQLHHAQYNILLSVELSFWHCWFLTEIQHWT
jgi:hypothetical protein